jgi:hypothetical protein
MTLRLNHVLTPLLLCLAVLCAHAQVGTWPPSSGYLYFGANELDQNNPSKYSLLQSKTTGETYLNSPDKILFRIGNSDKMILSNNGSIGIGTTTPQTNLEIRSAGSNTELKIRHMNEAEAAWGLILRQKSDLNTEITAGGRNLQIESGWDKNLFLGSINYNTAGGKVVFPGGKVGIGTDDPVGKLEVYGGGDLTIRGSTADAGDVVFLTNTKSQLGRIWTQDPGKLHLSTNDNNPDMTISTNGFVGVGTLNPDQRLTVKGKVHAEEIVVDLSVPAPDYVFEPDYKLPSLFEIEMFVKENKHLPEVPSSKEMEENGLNLKEMNLLLLKKVEELTLHLIDMNKENQELKKRLDKIEEKVR